MQIRETEVLLPANNSTVIGEVNGFPDGAIPFAELAVEGEPISRRRYVVKPYHKLGLVKSEIRVTVKNGTATYLSDAFVLGVCLDLNGEDAGLSDNYFDLYPGRPYTVALGQLSGEVLYAYMGM